MDKNFSEIIDAIHENDPRYKTAAYEFLMDALNFTQKKFKRSRHVNGEELLEGIKDLLMVRFGPMALTVLHHWGIKTTEDFGNVVFNLVNNRILSKTEEDSIETFRKGFDFNEIFQQGYRRQLEKRVSRMR